MKHAVYAPNFNDYGQPARLVELAQAAEEAGYDGFFIWDHLVFAAGGELEVCDATVTLGAIAQATTRLRIGAMITPLARRRPWKLAREIVSLDHLSGGRITLGVGLGEPAELEFAAFGEDPAARVRAARLDEGLLIVDTLMRGHELSHHGRYYDVDRAHFAPPCLQQPRVPVWVAATLPARAGLRRAAHWDGVFPVRMPNDFEPEPGAAIDWSRWWPDRAAFAGLVAAVERERAAAGHAGEPFDFVASGRLGASEREDAPIAAYAAAGATWWCAWVDEAPGTFAASLAHVRRGPAR